MTTQKYAIEVGAPPRLELEWESYMRDFQVRFDGEEIGRITTGKRSLREPHLFTLPDGSELSIRLHESGLTEELELLRDGRPLPGSAADPFTKFSAAIRTSFFWGVVLIFVGIAAAISNSNLIRELVFAPSSAVFGLILIGLAYWMSRQSVVAGMLAAAVVLAEFILCLTLNIDAGTPVNVLTTIGIVLRVAFFVPIVQGIRPLRSL
jgi:hypothetical protein